ncbi:MAG: Rieske 2Fe-2S domain-containing protein [Parvibaculum sp.]
MGPIQHDATKFNPNNLPMQLAARYERVVGASLARVWENVLDWEHLPHLHHSSFSSLELEDAGNWGWRALTKGQPADKAPETRIELAVDRQNSRYVSRTLEGGLPGMEIWTALSAQGDRKTAIQVDFHIPHLSEQDTKKLGPYMMALYTNLWDEDERMMQERQIALDTRSKARAREALDLGPTIDLKARLPLTLTWGDHKVHVAEIDGKAHAFHAECPHLLAPLDEAHLGTDGIITCPWHGYRFDVRTGTSADGKSLQMKHCFELQTEENGHTYLRQTKKGPAQKCEDPSSLR